jgi:transposase
MWVPPEEKDPIVLHAPTRKSVALFGAVNVRTGQLVTMLIPQFDAETFEVFMTILLRHCSRSRRMVVVLDNARYHHAQQSRLFFREHRRQLHLDFLPPYSPELNPIERVWKLLRTCATHNQYFAELEDLLAAVTKQLIAWGKPNTVLARLCRLVPAIP